MNQEETLKAEPKLYEGLRKDWLGNHLNQFVVIAGEHIAGFYPDYESAFKSAIREFGIKRQFLIKQICAAEPVYVVY